jgi:DNA polymerase III delta subunit
MFAEDRTAEYMVVGAFAFHLRKLFEAKVLLGMGVSTAEVSKRLRIWSSKDRFFSQISRMSLVHIGNSLQKLAEIDHAVKTGRTRVQIAMEQLVLNLSSI